MSETQTTADIDSEPAETSDQQSFLSVFARTVRNDRLALVGTIGLGITIFVAVFGPFVLPHDPTATNLDQMNQAPSFVHPFGTDRYGRDILARVALGARTSLIVAFIGVAVAAGVGVALGAIAGYYEGLLGEGIMRFADTIFSFPALLLALAMVAIMGQNWYNVIIAVGVVYWPIFARITRGSVLAVKDEEFVQAARSIGESDFRIIGSEILPNITAPIIVQGTISMAVAILLESALSFLGLGVPPPDPSWGRMLADSRQFMTHAPWWTMAPGLAIMFTVLNLNFVGDALRDALDPHQGDEMEATR